MAKPRKALIFGVSGLIGSSLAPLLNKEYDVVVAPVRRPHGTNDPKLQTPVVDFGNLATETGIFENTETLFYCLGTTRRQAGSFAKFRELEWTLINQVLGSAKTFGVKKVVMISAQGADENSIWGYMRVKGDLERFAQSLQFDRLVIARPSLLMGERSEHRVLEGLSISILRPFLKPLQRCLPSSAPIQDIELARALLKCSQRANSGLWIVENKELLELAGALEKLRLGPVKI